MALVRKTPRSGYWSVLPYRGANEEKDCPTMPCGTERAAPSPFALKLTSSLCLGPDSQPYTWLPRTVMVQFPAENLALDITSISIESS